MIMIQVSESFIKQFEILDFLCSCAVSPENRCVYEACDSGCVSRCSGKLALHIRSPAVPAASLGTFDSNFFQVGDDSRGEVEKGVPVFLSHDGELVNGSS